MKRIIALIVSIALALPVMGAPGAAFATPQYHKFCAHGISGSDDLANRLDTSLKADPTGHKRLEGCEVTPLQVVAAFTAAAPEEGVTLANVVDYARTGLVLKTLTERTTFYTSCVKGKSLDADDVKMDCKVETLAAGTKVLASRKTGKSLVKLDCANIGFTPVKAPSCDLIIFETRDVAGTHSPRAHIPVYGPGESAACHGERDVTLDKDGTIRFVGPSRDITPGCIDRTPSCSYDGADRMAAPRRRTFDGTVDGLTTGFHAILVDPGFSTNPGDALGICVEVVDASGKRLETSLTDIVRNVDYKQMPNGQRIARIFYTDADMTAAGVKEDDPGGLYLWKAR